MLEGEQSSSVGDLITLKVNMFLVALLFVLRMEIGHICIYLLLNRGKVFIHANIAKSSEKMLKSEEMK